MGRGPHFRRGRSRGAPVAACLAAVVALGAGCARAESGASSALDSQFLSAVHSQASDVGGYRSDVQLVRLGHAACDAFRSGASYQQLADRLVLLEGHNPLPSEDLGTVITAAVDTYCPQYRSKVQ